MDKGIVVALKWRVILWNPNTTRAVGDGFMRDIGKLGWRQARSLALRYQARFVDLTR